MKVRIDYTIEVPDDIRRAIRKWYGQEGLASREEVKDWYIRFGSSMDMDLSRSLDSEE
jgi:hypothetical protein